MVARGSRRTFQAAKDKCKLEQALDEAERKVGGVEKEAVEGLETVVPNFLKQAWRPQGIHHASLESTIKEPARLSPCGQRTRWRTAPETSHLGLFC